MLERGLSYEDCKTKLCEIATVEDFWSAFNSLPKPSQIFFDGKMRKRFSDRAVESFSIFKKNIKPEWEDPMNAKGAELVCRKAFPPQQLDDLWTNLVLGIIGETLDPADEICGVRVVDKSVNSRVQQRFELWYKKNDESLAGDLRDRLSSTLGKSAVQCKWDVKPH